MLFMFHLSSFEDHYGRSRCGHDAGISFYTTKLAFKLIATSFYTIKEGDPKGLCEAPPKCNGGGKTSRVFPWISIEVARKPLCLSIRYPLGVERQIITPCSKPLHHFSAVHHIGLLWEDHPIRRILPIPEVLHKSVLLWVLMDVGDHIPKLPIRRNRDAPERMLE